MTDAPPTNGTKAKLEEHDRRLDAGDRGRERLWAAPVMWMAKVA